MIDSIPRLIYMFIVGGLGFFLYKYLLREYFFNMKKDSLYVLDVCIYIIYLPFTIFILLYRILMIKIK